MDSLNINPFNPGYITITSLKIFGRRLGNMKSLSWKIFTEGWGEEMTHQEYTKLLEGD